jgi:hypothetical protein
MKILLTLKQAPAQQHRRAHGHDHAASFRNESIASLYPDGAQAMSLFWESTTKIRGQLKVLEAFMSGQSSICKDCLDGMKTLADRQTVKAAQDLASKWLVYTEETMKTIKAITKVCDAIMVEAVGAPKLPEPPLRIGYNGSSNGATPEPGHSQYRPIQILNTFYRLASTKD